MTAPDDPDRVLIFDTTLRDGEQSPGISLNVAEKFEIAQQLARLGVDVIEAGFPITSPGDFEAVESIAREVEGPIVAGLARTHVADIDAAYEAVKDAERPRIHTFISTSDIHIEHQLQTTREDVKGQARAAVAHARGYVEDVEFSPMDATRADVEYTAEVCAIALEEGATTINIPDTVGYTMPHEFTAYLERLYELVPRLRDVVVSVHCHDDLGLAVANSFAGVLVGARQVECGINGIGEGAGNASLEEIAMLLHTRQADVGLSTGMVTTEIAHKKKQVTGMDLEALVTDELRAAEGAYSLLWFDVEASSRRPPHARVGVRLPDGTESEGAFTGDGPIDAVFRAINAATASEAKLREFRVDAVTGGQDALGETSVVLELSGVTASGQGVSTDIIEAAGRAYVRALSNAERRHLAATREAEPEVSGAATP